MESRKSVEPAQFMKVLPHGLALGMELTELGAGKAEIRLPYKADLVGDPETGVLHGGAISAAMDTCCGAAVMCHPQVKGITATIDLRIDYMRAATPGDTIVTQAECYHLTRSVAFVRGMAFDADDQSLVATVAGTFMVGKPS